MNPWKTLLSSLCTLLLIGCTQTVVNYSAYAPLPRGTKVAVIPFNNYTETPLAGERAMSITAGILKSRGFCDVVMYQPHNKPSLFPMTNAGPSRQALYRWARQAHARFIVTGSVNEWSYKVGLDGEPVVGLAVRAHDVSNGRTMWSAVGSSSEGSRVAVSTAAQKLLNQMLLRMFGS